MDRDAPHFEVPHLDVLLPDDWQDWRTLRLRALTESPEAFCARLEEWADADETRWRARLHDVQLNLVARLGGAAVGQVSADGAAPGPEVELTSLWVAPEARGHGVGGALIDRVIGWAARSERGVRLEVHLDNAVARRRYRAREFTVRADRPATAGTEVMVRDWTGTI